MLAHRQQFHQSRLAESTIPSSIPYQKAVKQATHYFAEPAPPRRRKAQAFAWIGQQVPEQSSLMAYIDVFWVLMLMALSAIPLALMLRKVKLGAAAPAGH